MSQPKQTAKQIGDIAAARCRAYRAVQDADNRDEANIVYDLADLVDKSELPTRARIKALRWLADQISG